MTEIETDVTGYINVCITDEFGGGQAFPLKELVERLITYTNSYGGQGALRICMYYKDENGEIKPLIPQGTNPERDDNENIHYNR